MWRLRRRAAGRCTGPYAGAAVGAMYGPCRRRASGDAAVVRVVVCTGARPLVRILVRGGVRVGSVGLEGSGLVSIRGGGRVVAHDCFMALAPPPRCWHSCGLFTGL